MPILPVHTASSGPDPRAVSFANLPLELLQRRNVNWIVLPVGAFGNVKPCDCDNSYYSSPASLLDLRVAGLWTVIFLFSMVREADPQERMLLLRPALR